MLFSCKWCHRIRGLALCAKNYINQKFGPHLISVMVNDLRKSRVDESRDFLGYGTFSLNFSYYFKVKTCFSAPLPTAHTPNNLHSITYHENNVQNSNQKIPNHRTTWPLGNFSHAWIIFNQSNSMLPHKTWLHHVSSVKTTCLLSRTLIALSNPTEKNSHGTKCYWWWTFHAILPRFDFI